MAHWLNCEPLAGTAAPFDLTDRGLMLGDGVFDTALVLGGRVVWREAHLGRLVDACAAIRLPIAPERLAEAMDQAARPVAFGAMRLTVTRGPAPRGLALPADPVPTLLAASTEMAESPAFLPVTLWPSTIRRNEHAPSSRLKSLGYLDNVLALAEARDHGAGDALILNTAGRVACTGIGNVFCLKGDHLVTPALDEGVLPGIARAQVLRLARRMGFDVRETRLAPDDLIEADSVFVTNSLKLLAPVTELAGKSLKKPENGGIAGLTAALRADIARDHGASADLLSPRSRA